MRRAFASASSAPAFNYDPYGAPLTGPAPTTDFGFAGLFNHQASGLSLTLYRAYDPASGRWLSRDPIGEEGDPYGNLYPYVAGSTPNSRDPLGLVGTPGLTVPGESNARFCEDVSWDEAAVNPYQIMNDAECLLAGAGGCNPFKKGAGGAGGRSGGAKPKPDPKYGATPEGRPYTKHYGTETGPQRNIPGSVVDHVINTTKGVPGRGGTTVHYDPVNNVTVVTGRGGAIVSAHKGPP